VSAAVEPLTIGRFSPSCSRALSQWSVGDHPRRGAWRRYAGWPLGRTVPGTRRGLPGRLGKARSCCRADSKCPDAGRRKAGSWRARRASRRWGCRPSHGHRLLSKSEPSQRSDTGTLRSRSGRLHGAGISRLRICEMSPMADICRFPGQLFMRGGRAVVWGGVRPLFDSAAFNPDFQVYRLGRQDDRPP
jgi:hypothetical protein